MSESTLREGLKTELRKKAYKTVKGQKLAQVETAKRMVACKGLSDEREAGDLDPSKIIFAGE